MRHFLFPACLLLAQPAQARAASPVRMPASVVAGSCPAPQWPATRMRIEEVGTVKIAFVIGPDGRVLDYRIEQSAGHRLWDEAAVKALSRCRFLPGRLDGKPARDIVKMKHTWTLD
ncbi:energy transducer TonB [Massilia sp. DJPM01]|uniref:energy transducer TonB n=1 Tax=Massilia sp. DJPM01 TaxID=3024404 RepID=UPI00259FC831|nr:energy transducer TonB [Massilia sp. DJPM01]MDM5176194.1 energy transducer TonB [Massilia sp. DJPM01]